MKTNLWQLIVDQFRVSLQSQSVGADIKNSAAIVFADYYGRKQNLLPPIIAPVGDERTSVRLVRVGRATIVATKVRFQRFFKAAAE
jgi:hypothetical protein